MNKNIKISLVLLAVIISMGFYGLREAGGESAKNSSINNEFQETSMPTLEKYLGLDYNKLNKVQIKELSKIYDKISNFKFAEDNSNYEDYELLLDDYNSKLGSYGIDVPFSYYSQYIYIV